MASKTDFRERPRCHQPKEKLPNALKQQPDQSGSARFARERLEAILYGVYLPESSREDIVGGVVDALDVLRGSEEEDQENEEDEEDEEDEDFGDKGD